MKSVVSVLGGETQRLRTTTYAALRALGILALLFGVARGTESAPALALLAAAERAPLVVVGRVGAVTRIDNSAFAAALRVSHTLRGAVAVDTELPIAWEELARDRPPRLVDGQSVLLALDDLPSSSLWRTRAQGHPGLRLIAADGDALLRDPTAADVKQLTTYLALPRDASPASRAAGLVRLALESSDGLSGAAIARLRAAPELCAALSADATATLMRLAADARRPLALRDAVIRLAGAAHLTAAAPALERLAVAGAPLEAPALLALAQIRGGLPAARVEPLLARPDAELRAVGARYATGTLAERTLPELVRGDPSPLVRSAAAEGLAATRTVWGVEACLPALADVDPPVRAAAATALGRLGAPAVPALEQAARTVPAQAAGAVTALSLAGPTGVAALRRLEATARPSRCATSPAWRWAKGPHAHWAPALAATCSTLRRALQWEGMTSPTTPPCKLPVAAATPPDAKDPATWTPESLAAFRRSSTAAAPAPGRRCATPSITPSAASTPPPSSRSGTARA